MSRDQRIEKYGDWMNDPSQDPPGEGINLALEDVKLRKSSQFGTQISKKGAAPFRPLRFLAWMGLIAGAGVAVAHGDAAWWVKLVFVAIMAGLGGFLYSQIDHEGERADRAEDRTVEVEDEMALFPAADFIRGMNKHGVDIILSGGELGPRSTSKLRFPATVFHKHLTDSMVFGYRRALELEDRMLIQPEEDEVRLVFEKIAGNWIEQMMQGTR